MNRSNKKRLEEMEHKAPSSGNRESVFWDRLGQEWTEEQKAWILKRHPNCRTFMKPLSPTMPYGYERQGEEAVALYRDLVSLVDWEAGERLSEELARAFQENLKRMQHLRALPGD